MGGRRRNPNPRADREWSRRGPLERVELQFSIAEFRQICRLRRGMAFGRSVKKCIGEIKFGLAPRFLKIDQRVCPAFQMRNTPPVDMKKRVATVERKERSAER